MNNETNANEIICQLLIDYGVGHEGFSPSAMARRITDCLAEVELITPDE